MGCQGERDFIVIKCSGTPAIRHVTSSALHAKRARVCVVLGVAGSAVHGCAFEDAIYMTTLARRCQMFAFKMECEFRVIDVDRLPAIGRVASSALRAKRALMRVILGVTCETILRGCLQVRELARVDMAFGTRDKGVLANQVKRHLIMVEGCAM